MDTIKLGHVPSLDHPDCRPLEVIEALIDAGQLRRFRKRWGARGIGDCHEITLALMSGLQKAKAPGLWLHMAGDTQQIGLHSWIECDGWAIDASNGAEDRPVVIMRADEYRRQMGVIEALPVDHPRIQGRIAAEPVT